MSDRAWDVHTCHAACPCHKGEHPVPDFEEASDFGAMSEAGVGLVCHDCSFQTASEAKADAHYALTGHTLSFDYIECESSWPTLNDPAGVLP